MQNTDGNEAVIPGAPATQEILTQELLHDSLQTGSRMRKALLISGMLSILGFVGLFMHFASGTSDHTTWNFYAVVYFYVFSVTMGIPMAGIGLRMARAQWRRPTSRSAELFAIAGPINLIFSVALVIPSISVTARRLHDINKSGWWQLLWITIIGGILLIIWHATEGENKKNRFGPPIKFKK